MMQEEKSPAMLNSVIACSSGPLTQSLVHLQVYQPLTSFSTPLGTGNDTAADTLGDIIADDSGRIPEQLALHRNLQIDMDNVLDTLTPRESGILRSRYGLDDGCQKTLEEVGVLFNVCTSFSFGALCLLLLSAFSP